MKWSDWVVLACVIVVIAAFWLARRAAGRKRVEAISAALSAAHAAGYASAELVFQQRQELAAQARAENNTQVIVEGARGDGGPGDRDDRIIAAILERVRAGLDPIPDDRRNGVRVDGFIGTGDRTVPVDLRDGGRAVVAGVRASLGSEQVPRVLIDELDRLTEPADGSGSTSGQG